MKDIKQPQGRMWSGRGL